ncbi:hypothetical protein E3N88_26615 [Mikania micrantha]|uniref:SHSP domain-containing protein n=1 Tax=Mikania micrantha TaxID=192012 RepID=A0A5N6MVU0_9ASTR|nr:hypothetical protein E3N88_26615 [Mikania micrantha]
MDISLMGFDSPLLRNLHHILEATEDNTTGNKSTNSGPTYAYVRDARAMAATPADVKEYPNSYVFIVDMPGLKEKKMINGTLCNGLSRRLDAPLAVRALTSSGRWRNPLDDMDAKVIVPEKKTVISDLEFFRVHE